MKKYLLLASMLLAGVTPMLADIEDDIYFDPKKAAHKSNQDSGASSRNRSNYIADFQNMDVDEYNSRGQYYLTPIDTIGARTENEQDFVYTTQIQKYYNPTIVVDNENLLADVLNNSYGNVTVEYNLNGVPTFGTWYGAGYYNYMFYSPYIYGVPLYGPASWNPYWAWNWGWNSSWAWSWGPLWSWNWGPSYWNPGYWGPGYWGPSRPVYWASNRPGGNRPVGPAPGWSSHRPGVNLAGHTPTGRPGNGRPTSGTSMGNNNSAGYGRQPGQGAYTQTRPGSTNGNRYQTNGGSTRPGGYTIGSDGHRRTGGNNGASTQPSQPNRNTGVSSGSYRGNGNSGKSSNRSYNSGSNSNRYNSSGYNSNNSYNSGSNSNRSYNSGSYSTGGGHRSSGGGFGGGSHGGGGGSRGGRR